MVNHGLSAPVRLRFAPSPNGRLHLGHAYSALLNAHIAQALHGEFLVRLEDIDVTRCTPELAAYCLEDLAWLGLTWKQPVRVQSQHWQDYREAWGKLKERGLLYPCFCTRKKVALASHAHDPDGAPLYMGTCKRYSRAQVEALMEAGAPYCLRLDMEKALGMAGADLSYTRFVPFTQETERVRAEPQRWGDAVMVRKEIPSSYHVSVVVDDALQGISHVVRGNDLEAATCLHALLQALLGLPVPLYHHHALLAEDDGLKLSKSRGSESLASLREKGAAPEEIRLALLKRIK